MRIPSWFALFVLLVTACPATDGSLGHARRAQALLGPEVWSQIIRVENSAPTRKYPRTLHALVFELAGVLWFYTDADGTQSFSLHRNRLAQEKADFAPLLRDLDRGFERWVTVGPGGEESDATAAAAELPNGCFIESYAALRRLVARGVPVSEPRLLSYYARTPRRQTGHTVLVYSVNGRLAVVDPLRPETELRFPASFSAEPMELARAIQGPEVGHAILLPLPLPAGRAPGEVFAANGPRAGSLPL